MITQFILILMIFSFSKAQCTSGVPCDGDTTYPAMTSISGFETFAACKEAGDAWSATKRDLDRDYVCIPARAK